jgi:hypothetical protein
MVRYRVSPDQAALNEKLVREVYEELGRLRPAGFRYRTFRLDDGVTFVHLASHDGDGNPLAGVEAFGRFQESLRDRCDDPPVLSQLVEVGSYGFPADAA